MTDEVIGKHVGSYVLMEKLGSGGFGHVYKARHAHLPNRIVALKIFKETSDVETFLREARLLDQLRHASILSVIDVLIGLHAFFVGSSSERDRPLWGVVAWVTEVSFCVWCLFVLFVHSVDGVFGWFVWTILVSSLIASLYWWCYPLEE